MKAVEASLSASRIEVGVDDIDALTIFDDGHAGDEERGITIGWTPDAALVPPVQLDA